MQGRLWPRSDEEREKAEKAGYDISKVSESQNLIVLQLVRLTCSRRMPSVASLIKMGGCKTWSIHLGRCCQQQQPSRLYMCYKYINLS